jgi:hypothetical protein
MKPGGVPDSRFQRFEFALRAPFVNYWCATVDMSVPGLVFSKMLSFQQTGSAAHHRSPFAFTTLRVACGLLFSGIAGRLDKGRSCRGGNNEKEAGGHHVDAMLRRM